MWLIYFLCGHSLLQLLVSDFMLPPIPFWMPFINANLQVAQSISHMSLSNCMNLSNINLVYIQNSALKCTLIERLTCINSTSEIRHNSVMLIYIRVDITGLKTSHAHWSKSENVPSWGNNTIPYKGTKEPSKVTVIVDYSCNNKLIK